MPGIGVITNPRSRRNRRDPRLAKHLAYVLGEEGQLYSPKDLDALESVARHFLEREVEVLAINGGDGTAHVVLSAFVHVYGETPLPKIALLRGGTMNTVATGLGIRGRPEGLLGKLVDQYHAGEPLAVVERNLLMVEDHVGFLFGNGLVTRMLAVYYGGSEPTPWKAFRLLVRAVCSTIIGGGFIKRLIAPIVVEVELDGRLLPHRNWLCLMAGTVEDIGMRFRPFTRVTRHPGCLEVMGIACTVKRLMLLLPAMRRARLMEDPEVAMELGKRLVMRSPDPIPYTIDGDSFPGNNELVIQVGPRVQLVV
jgi:diacylglycerol kinase (ATP)